MFEVAFSSFEASVLSRRLRSNSRQNWDGLSYIRLKMHKHGVRRRFAHPSDVILHLTSSPLSKANVGFMTRSALLCLLVLLVSATALLVGLNACGTPTTPSRLGQGKLLHIVIVVQENRTPRQPIPRSSIDGKGGGYCHHCQYILGL
jgi:hypothetical protein